MGWPFQWVLQGLVVLHAGYTLGMGQERAGVNYAFGALPLHPFLCLSLLPLLAVPQEPQLVPASISPEEATAVESAHPK